MFNVVAGRLSECVKDDKVQASNPNVVLKKINFLKINGDDKSCVGWYRFNIFGDPLAL